MIIHDNEELACKLHSASYIFLAIGAGVISTLFAVTMQFSPGLYVVARPGEVITNTGQMLAIRHAIELLYFSLFPAVTGGFGNWLVPSLIGSRQMAFPMLDSLALSLLLLGLILTFGDIVVGKGQNFPVFFSLLAWSSAVILWSANMITTILNNRIRSMPFSCLPFIVWTQLITAVVALVSAPVMAALCILGSEEGKVISDIILQRTLLEWFSPPQMLLLTIPSLGIAVHILGICNNGTSLRETFYSIVIMATTVIMIMVPWLRIRISPHASPLYHAQWMENFFSSFALSLSLFCISIIWFKRIRSSVLKKLSVLFVWVLWSVVLMMTGVVMVLINPELSSKHSPFVFAIVSIMFGAFYCWLKELGGTQRHPWLEWIHVSCYVIGSLLTLSFILGVSSTGPMPGAFFMGLNTILFLIQCIMAFREHSLHNDIIQMWTIVTKAGFPFNILSRWYHS